MAEFFALGTIVKLGTNTITEVTSVSGPSFSSDDIEVTSHDDVDGFKRFIKGLTDSGEFTIEGSFDYVNAGYIMASLETRSESSFTVTLPTTPSVTVWSANVYCKTYSTDAPVDGKIGYSAAVKINGKPSLTQV